MYGEPTLAVGVTKRLTGDILEGGVVVLDRAALGWLVRPCEDALQVRVGAALVFATGDLSHSTRLGFGFETEVSYLFRDGLRLGARVGIDHHSFLRSATSDGTTVMPMFGLRARIRDNVVVGVDSFYVHYDSQLWGRSTAAGVMGTVSLDGRPGLIVGSVNAGILLLGFGLQFLRLASGA
jgi:hypothetical protein